ncbi:hypothetical protein CHS0354_005744 [Potamilus streckersoni]|uniref:SIPAR domain-containing protein n=1 Tax=Potamilus streckersoni TaxID=2493646 RepID=A0AAE0RW72_9BIVA|nr:hypothetical protein CHS0354_005744 [Potamilus streckersoni]
MSRGVRDLRDLICVSRLSFHHSEEEEYFSDDNLHQDLDNISIGSTGSSDCGRHDSKNEVMSPQRVSPDSGCITNGGSPLHLFSSDNLIIPTAPSETRFKKSRINKNKKKKVLDTEPTRHELPRLTPLPPVGASIQVNNNDTVDEPGSKSTSHTEEDMLDKEVRPVSAPPPPHHAQFKQHLKKTAPRNNFDAVLSYMDATVVSGWLTRANRSVGDLTHFCKTEDNFVQFAHFWLTDFSDRQKKEIFELEHEILVEELNFAFAVGKDQRKISHRDITGLIKALFHEYPVKLLSSKGPHLFLDYLDILSSERTSDYKKLLSDVKCSTKNRQFAQWLLATRSFALVSVWMAVLNFYHNLQGRSQGPRLPQSDSSDTDANERRIQQAIQLGYIDVVHYLIVSGQVDPQRIDEHGRTLIFNAVMHSRPKIVQYLISRVKPAIDVNRASDTGNTALHAAANNGNVNLVTELLMNPDIDVNCCNSQCENATPLHLAVMHGHAEIVGALLRAGANFSQKMGNMLPLDIARDFDHHDVVKLLRARMSNESLDLTSTARETREP